MLTVGREGAVVGRETGGEGKLSGSGSDDVRSDMVV